MSWVESQYLIAACSFFSLHDRLLFATVNVGIEYRPDEWEPIHRRVGILTHSNL